MAYSLVMLLVFARVVSVVMTAPILGTRQLPFKFRLLLAGFISMAVLPVASIHTPVIDGAGDLLTAVFSEIVIGILLGLGVMIFFTAAQAAGSVIGQMAGIQWPTMGASETGGESGPVGQLFAILSLAAFAAIGGPEMVVAAVMETTIEFPLGTSLQVTDTLMFLGELLQQSFLLTLRGVAPAATAILIATVVIGLVSRSFPQMNMLGFGLNSNQLILFLAIFLTMGGCVWLFVDDLANVMAMIQDALHHLKNRESFACAEVFHHE